MFPHNAIKRPRQWLRGSDWTRSDWISSPISSRHSLALSQSIQFSVYKHDISIDIWRLLHNEHDHTVVVTPTHYIMFTVS